MESDLYCEVCDVKLSDPSAKEAHFNGIYLD